MLRRATESPPQFLMWKLFQASGKPIWKFWYSHRAKNAGTFNRDALELATNTDPFRRSYSSLGQALPAENHQWILTQATQAMTGRIEILGYGSDNFGDPINWSRDPFHKTEWPTGPALGLPVTLGDEMGDIKIQWEVNRLQHLCHLAQAWVLLHDDRFLTSWIDTFSHWRRSNPMGMNVAWSCPMEVGIRSLNIMISAAMVWSHISIDVRQSVIQTLKEHQQYLFRHPERSDISGNHYLVNLACALMLDLNICQGEHSKQGRRVAQAFLVEVETQFAEGFHFELSTNYHRYMTELLGLTCLEYLRWGHPVPPRLIETLDHAASWISRLAGNSDSLPLIGDNDSGQFFKLDSRPPNDRRLVLALADCVTHATISGTEESPAASWILGGMSILAPLHPIESPPLRTATAGGYATVNTPTAHVVVRSGKPGLLGRGGHDHGDLTSPTIDFNGRPIVVDPGTYRYTYSKAEREAEISAFRHNVLIIDHVNPQPPIIGSVMATTSTRTIGTVEVREAAGYSIIQCGHNGYVNTAGIKEFSRTISVRNNQPEVTVVDRIEGDSLHHFTSRWHFHPDLSLIKETGGRFTVSERSTGKTIGQVEVREAWNKEVVEAYKYSSDYGAQQDGQALLLSTQAVSPAKFTIHFSWFEAPQ